MAKRTGRQKNQLPTCYYEGYLDKRSFKDKTSRRLWACLCGNTLYFFNEKRDTDYVERIDLSEFMSITDDNSQDRNLDAARLNLQMKNTNIKLTAPNAETRELWKGYIHSIAELTCPSSLNLLPGQIHAIREAIEKEKDRIRSASAPALSDFNPYVSIKADMPACFHTVSRLEAELLLEREANRGNLLLRPGRDGNFAITTRQELDGSVFRHYRVTRKYEGGFAIDVDNPVLCATLHDVVNYMVEKTEGVSIPLTMEGIYERRISFVWSDSENGEKSIQQAQPNNVPPSLPPKPDSRIPIPEQAPEQADKENFYLNDKQKNTEKMPGNSCEAPQPPPKKAMLPPTPAPRKSTSYPTPIPSFTSSSNNEDTKTRSHRETPGQIPLAAISELKLKLEQKAKCHE